MSRQGRFEESIKDRIYTSIRVKEEVAKLHLGIINNISELMIASYKEKKHVYWFGNGGSAADAQHLACELVNKFYIKRPGLFSVALTTNTSNLTAIANDFSYDVIFEKQVEALAEKGDILIGLSTSGNSLNVLKAFELGRKIGTVNIGLSGSGGKMKSYVDYLIDVPSTDSPVIQESHIMIGHIICDIVERELFKKD